MTEEISIEQVKCLISDLHPRYLTQAGYLLQQVAELAIRQAEEMAALNSQLESVQQTNEAMGKRLLRQDDENHRLRDDNQYFVVSLKDIIHTTDVNDLKNSYLEHIEIIARDALKRILDNEADK